jgi:catechol 2,3-dioxygenase-like lactoylglutathione lyase family enzyme
MNMKKSSTEESNKGTCFVLSPFQDHFHHDYKHILQPAIKNAGLNPLRADNIYGAKPVIADIWRSINSARIILAEMSGNNPNVLYEIGLAHAIGKPVVMITEKKEDMPFDLQHLRHIPYERLKSDWAKDLRKNIKSYLVETLEDEKNSKPFLDDINSIPNPIEPWKPDELHHVSLAVRDLEKSRAFYNNVLGLLEIKKDEIKVDDVLLKGAWFELPSGQQLHLLLSPGGTFRNEVNGLYYRDCHFALRVSDFHAAKLHLKEKSIDILPDRSNSRSYALFYIIDPDGHVVEINAGSFHELKTEPVLPEGP